MDDAQKLKLLDFILENVTEYKVKDYGWVYADSESPETILRCFESIEYLTNNHEPEDDE